MDDTTWELIATERRTLADLLEPLTPEQWAAGSLCSEWRVRDVAAHLAMTPAGVPSGATLVRALLASRGDLWGAGRDVVVAYAQATPTDALVAGLRRDAATRTKPWFVFAPNILLDLVVHGQDIAVPLQIPRPVPPAAGRWALARTWSMGWPFHARRRFGDVTLHADDCDWSGGQGPTVEGSAASLLLLMTGRRGALDDVRGPGVAVIRSRTGEQRRPQTQRGARP